jgi:DNA-binding HxlR family transcriptional regulator
MKLVNEHLWAVLNALSKKRMGFNELLREIKTNPRTLSHNLSELCKLGLVKRVVYKASPIRVTYELTPKGVRITAILREVV